MRSRIPLAGCVVLAVLVGSSAFGTNTARATVTGQDTSTLDDQVELSLTVYNSDLALVRDVRNLQLSSSRRARPICASWTSLLLSILRRCTSAR